MSDFLVSKIKNNKSFSLIVGTLVIASIATAGLLNLGFNAVNKFANAAAPNTADLIIGQKDTGTAIEVSVCTKATDGPIHLTNVSNWFQFDNSALTPSATILEKGFYGNSTDGYGQLKWQQVLPAPVSPNTTDIYTMRLDFTGDSVSAGQTGIAMQIANKELVGRLKFDKVSGSTGSTAITLVKNKYYSTENPNDPLIQNVTNVIGDCRGTSNISSLQASSVVSSSAVNLSSSIASVSSSTISLNSSNANTMSSAIANQPSVNGSNNSDLVIGTYNTGTTVELSVCVKSTPGPLSLSNVSNWYQYDTTALTPSPTILEKGLYGNGNNGYGQLKWQQVLGSQIGNLNSYSLRLDFTGDGVSMGQTGISMNSNFNELYGKVKFDIINASGNTNINLAKNIFYSIENPNDPIIQAVKYVNGDCRGTVTANSSSLTTNSTSMTNSSYSLVTSSNTVITQSSSMTTGSLIGACSAVGSSYLNGVCVRIGLPNIPSGSGLGGVIGGQAPIIPLNGNTYPNGTSATFTPSGSSTPIQGTIVNGSFVPNFGQTIPADSATGLSSGTLTVNGTSLSVPTNFANPNSPTIGVLVAIPSRPIILVAGGQIPSIPFTGNTLPNGTPATLTLPGSTTPIQGTIINGSFVPNLGQTIPSNGTNGQGVAIVTAGGQVVAIPVSYSTGASTGGTITICAGTCNPNNTASNSNNSPSTNSTQPQNNNTSNSPQATISTGFKSKIRITDPYVCGEGSYGNVSSPVEFGVDAVYYEFYKVGSTTPSYSFKLKIASNGDFFLPITKTLNPVEEGDYKVVFYAFDKDKNKAEGQYTDYISTNCASEKLINSPLYRSVRTGGVSITALVIIMILSISSLYLYHKSKTKKKLDYDFKTKTEQD